MTKQGETSETQHKVTFAPFKKNIIYRLYLNCTLFSLLMVFRNSVSLYLTDKIDTDFIFS